MSVATDIALGTEWRRKRGRRHLPEALVIRNIYRYDREVLVRYGNGDQKTLSRAELLRDYNRA